MRMKIEEEEEEEEEEERVNVLYSPWFVDRIGSVWQIP
jgi:hypothetical protein